MVAVAEWGEALAVILMLICLAVVVVVVALVGKGSYPVVVRAEYKVTPPLLFQRIPACRSDPDS